MPTEGTWYAHGPRTVGPFPTEAEAQEAAASLEAESHIYSWADQNPTF